MQPRPGLSLTACSLLSCSALLSACAPAIQHRAPPLHEVVLLVGQSNMSGRGLDAQAPSAAMQHERVLMWDPAAGKLVPARDPMPHQDLHVKPVRVGPGLSFAHAYLNNGAPDARVVLVPAAFGGSGFSDKEGSWRVDRTPVSALTTEAVVRANAAVSALRASGAAVRVSAILWHQGETDGGNGMVAADYTQQLDALAGYLREHVDGAGPATPFLVGQYVPSQIAQVPALRAIAESNRALPGRLAHSACVGSRGLRGNPAPDSIHFDAPSQRAMGERYAAALVTLQLAASPVDCDW